MKLKSSLALVFLLFTVAPAIAQNSWQKIAPVGHTFTVMMPTKATRISRSVGMSGTDSSLVTFYQSVLKGKRFVAAGFHKMGVEGVPALSSFEKFVEGMEHSLRLNQKMKLLKFSGNLSVGGATGRQYELTLGESSGAARFLASENGFYVLVMIGGSREDRDAKRFFSSFRVGEVNTDEAVSGTENGGNVVTMLGSEGSTPKTATGEESPARAKGVVTLLRPAEDASTDEVPPQPWPEPAGLVSGGVKNGKAIKLVQPQYPAAARNNRETGQVKVQIVINEVGNVTAAHALNGSAVLKVAAEAAAWQCKFTPTFLTGQPVKVSGVIVYNFVAQ